ncbi:MAG: lipoyl(octanoyl) transferase LipB [Hyphomonadaceae bacterium]|nr:lipoyl(octanoyl) transferase LipB [Hyphomonadaceae bacterium]
MNAVVEWAVSPGLTPYRSAESWMRSRAAALAEGSAAERVWLLEHPPLYTAGLSARAEDVLDARFPVLPVERGGRLTYHGPGQRVAYVMLDLTRRGRDVRAFVRNLETWLIETLAGLGLEAFTREGRVGVWALDPETGAEAKIAAIGVRLRRWVSYHGIALNVAPDLSHFSGIVPCGIREHGVTSIAALGVEADMRKVDAVLNAAFEHVFGSETRLVSPPAARNPAPLLPQGDFFYDELMAAQPDAVGEFYRAQLAQSVRLD